MSHHRAGAGLEIYQYGSRSVIKIVAGCNQKWSADHFTGLDHFWLGGAKVSRRAIDGVFRW